MTSVIPSANLPSCFPLTAALIINADTPHYEEIIKDLPCKVITYGLEHDAQYQAAGITYDKYGHASFTVLKDGKKAGSFYLKVPGSHNVSNALAAIALAQLLQVPDEVTIKGLGSFTGTDRRFQYKGEVAGVTIVDDYAHHPTEDPGHLKRSTQLSAQETVVRIPASYLHPYQSSSSRVCTGA